MSIEKVREFFKQFNKDNDILEFDTSSATVELAAAAAGVIPARIAKTLSFYDKDGCALVVTAGDRRIDNGKFKKTFNMKARMLSPDKVLQFTGYEVGGVCPFAIDNPDVRIYCDSSMKRFDTVFPACGNSSSAIKLTCDELFQYSNSIEWVDVCKE